MTAFKNPKYRGSITLPPEFKDLGFCTKSTQEVKKCIAAGHRAYIYDNSYFLFKQTDVIHICHDCKIAWHINTEK